MINLDKLDEEITDTLDNETDNSLSNWLDKERSITYKELIIINERYRRGIFTLKEMELRKRVMTNGKRVAEMIESQNDGINPILGYKTK